jgi:AraC-like DNA-binding protein
MADPALPDPAVPAPAASEDLQTLRQQTLSLALRRAPGDGLHDTALPWLRLIRANAPAQPLPALYEPGLVLVLQGRKQARLGDTLLNYDALHCLLVSMTMLPRGRVVEASPERPYLCLRLSCETQALADLLLEMDAPPAEAAQGPGAPAGLNLAPVTAPLLGAALRLLQLLDTPQDLRTLAPLIRREMFYRLLTGPLGPRLRALAGSDGATQRVVRVIDQLTRRFAEPLRIDELAGLAHMSRSTLHQRFKQLTTLSPMQYQKQLRLQHARRLMLGDGLDATSAAHQVGYESPSQFSREYRRYFGAPPRSDIAQMRPSG